ncbi:TonB-dependent receptor domain-containing protein [Jiulongibacter sp. NS-SX5]|uniref:TonB-dependent receptor domain-containing protein n=1 Tax=Jiulongibacter sp. NS-SX5 TaxID=3463854 RepID=UPI004059F37B
MMKQILLLLIALPQLLLAQKVEVSGALQDQETGELLPFATVAFYFSSDSSTAYAGLTDDSGVFRAMLDPGSSYYGTVEYVGYSSKNITSPLLQPLEESANLGSIAMNSGSISLEAVEVRAEKSQMEFELDKRVFNVGKDLTNGGNTAADILDKVPSVNVDPEGNLTLRGSSGVQILIDGKPSGLLSSGDTEALMRMQGDIIDKIEVITNPSARYEAEGEAGIINIIMKKNQKKGFNGSFGLNAGVPHNHGASYNLNYRKKDFNFFSNFGIDYRRAPGFGFSTQEFYEGGNLTESYTVDTDSKRGGIGGYVQFGTDWIINDLNTLTGSVLLRRGKDNNTSTVIYEDFDGINTLQTFRDVIETEGERNIESTLNYKKTFENSKREFNFTFKYIFDKELELADYEQFVGSRAEPPLLQYSSNTEDEVNTLLQADYIHPFNENSKVEAGLRAALRTIDNVFTVEEQQNGEYVTLPDFDDNLAYQENIYAAYVIGGHKFDKLSIQGGLRTELTDIDARLLKSGANNDQNYLSLFPSTTFSYEMNRDNQIQASYSRRLSRPFFRRLLPFSNFNNPRNNSIGNPGLRPEFTNSTELGYLKFTENGTFLSSVYYRHTTGVIETIIIPSDDGTTIRYPVNLAERNAYGLEMNYTTNPFKWLDVTSDINFFRARVNGSFEDQDLSSDTYSMNGRISTKFTPGDMSQIQLTYDYDAPQNTTQGRTLSMSSFDAAGSLDVFKGNGTLTLSMRDIFNTRKRRSITDLPEFYSESVFQWRRARSFVLSLNYRLNQEKRRGDLLKEERGG